MNAIIRLKIDVSKIDKSALFKGAKGTYLDATLFLDDNEDKFGNNGSIRQDLGKDRRAKGEKGPILGNAKIVKLDIGDPKGSAQPEQSEQDDGDEIPF